LGKNRHLSIVKKAVGAIRRLFHFSFAVSSQAGGIKPDTSAAFCAYGRVMAKIAAYEQFMRVAIGEHEALTDQNPLLVDPEQRRKFVGKILRWDFGSLTQQMCDRFPNSLELRRLLKDAKVMRNYLAHEFWGGHFGNLHTERGIGIIVGECELRELHFEKLSEFFISETGIDTASYIQFVAAEARDEIRLRQWEELIAAAKVFQADGFAKE
jgi:hypothetical protein